MSSNLPLLGVVLMGGRSERMGEDKSGILYHGKTQYRYILEMLSAFCGEVVLSCNSSQATGLVDFPVVIDRYPDSGPLGGILSVAEAYPTYALLTAPCDLPNLTSAVLQSLVSGRNALKMATSCWNSDSGTIEPLLTIWEPRAARVLSAGREKQQLSVRRSLEANDVSIVYGLDPAAFSNVNTPEERDKAMRFLKEKKSGL